MQATIFVGCYKQHQCLRANIRQGSFSQALISVRDMYMPLFSLNRRVLFTGLVCAFTFSGLVQAEPITGDLGAGIGYKPRDPSASRYEVSAFPYMDLDWGDVNLSSDDGLNWKRSEER